MSADLLGLVRDFFADFEYKPGTSFNIQPGIYGIRVFMMRDLPDSTHPDHPMIRVGGSLEVPESLLMAAYDHRRLLQDLVHGWMRDMEMHECNEWFRVAGELPYDPHRRI